MMFFVWCFAILLIIASGQTDDVHLSDSLGQDAMKNGRVSYPGKLRFKRGLWGVEDDFFRNYYSDIGKESIYNQQKNGNIIRDWKPLGANSYSDATRQATSHYSNLARQGTNVDTQLNRVNQIVDRRIADAARYPNPDRGHQHAIRNWQNGQDNIQQSKQTWIQNNCNNRGKRSLGIFSALGRLFRIGSRLSRTRSFSRSRFGGFRSRSSTSRTGGSRSSSRRTSQGRRSWC